MFITSRFLNEGGPSAAALGGAEATAPAATPTAESVFDQASRHFFGAPEEDVATTDGSDEGTEDGGTEGEEGADFDAENAEEPTGEWTEESGAQKPEVEAFKPYVFNGKVFGKEQVQEFKTQKDLDSAIAKGIAAPHLYRQTQDLKAKLEELTPDAEYGRDLANMAKEDPKSLLNLIRDELVSEQVMADWVYESYTEYSRLAKMTPEERDRETRVKEANRIIEERQYLQQENERLNQQRQATAAEQEKREFNAWRNRELQKWQSKVPEQYKESVEASLRAVVALAKSKLDSGKKVTFTEMTKELEKFLTPMTHAKSPAAARREAGRAMEAKKNQATAALQGAARSGTRPAPASQGEKITRADQVFDRFRDLIGSGHKKLRN